MVGLSTTARLTGVVATAALLLLGATTPASADETPAAAAAAARWQSGEVDAQGGVPGFAGTDWGLTIDTLIALKATGVDPEVADRITGALKENVRAYNSLDAWDEKGQRVSGATAKLLYAAVITGSDAEKFGEYDLRAETLDLIAGPDKGLEEGRLKDKLKNGRDDSNTFGQSLAVLGLAGSGGVEQPVVDFLIDQQCAAGGFRLYPYAFGNGSGGVNGDCDAQSPAAVLDPDSSAMAIQALLAADAAGAEHAAAAAKKGAAWLKQIQREDGSFGGSGPTAASNTNSTGLAGQALAAAGLDTEADKAAKWVKDHQITEANAGKATDDLGTIAYNGDSLASAQAEGIPAFQRDQWRRATAQALLGIAQVPLGKIGLVEPDPGPDPGDGDGNGNGNGNGNGDSNGGNGSGDGDGGPGSSLADGRLPVTGSPLLPVAAVGVVLLAAGVVAVRLSARGSKS